MAQRDNLGLEGSWTKEEKIKLLAEFDNNLKRLQYFELNERSYVLDPNTPIYYGKSSENLNNWITVINNSIKAASVP